jgi:hypothetical protein
MTKLPCERCSFPAPMHWLHAGAGLARPNRNHRCADRALMRSERPPKWLLHSPDFAGVQTSRPHQAGIPPIIEIGANIKSP